jgi:hypothetical protein
VAFPDWKSGEPRQIWPEFFRAHQPSVSSVQALVIQMHGAQEHEHVIWAIQSALINGQAQPWMYEVLALSMELAGRPREEIERVVLSLSDFGGADFDSMMYSAAYLIRFERREAALRLYRQSSQLAPERAEPYILALNHARHVRDARAVEWASCGILRYAWTRDCVELHRDAENAALEAEQWLLRAGDKEGAERLKSAVAEAHERDLVLRLTWSGNADLDLIVEEPAGTVCSFENRDSPGGGVLTHDGYGPSAENCYEEYICAFGFRGDYRVRVRQSFGVPVSGRATLTLTRHAGTAEEQTETKTIVVDGNETAVAVSLDDGRRSGLKLVNTFDLRTQFDPAAVAERIPVETDQEVRQAALEEFEESRRRMARRAGAVGFQPVVAIIPEGAQLTTGAVVSADRRYVRINALPLFSTITDVFTFDFIGGGGGGAMNGGGGGGMAP